jgi:hypothetical protein
MSTGELVVATPNDFLEKETISVSYANPDKWEIADRDKGQTLVVATPNDFLEKETISVSYANPDNWEIVDRDKGQTWITHDNGYTWEVIVAE